MAATQFDESTTFYSNWGKEIDIAAPGGNTRVDQNGDGFPDASTGAQGSPVQVVSGLASVDVFDYRTDPSAECAAPPAVSNEAISIRDEATLRNSGPTSPSRVCVSLVFRK